MIPIPCAATVALTLASDWRGRKTRLPFVAGELCDLLVMMVFVFCETFSRLFLGTYL
jgi:hypothetical protein